MNRVPRCLAASTVAACLFMPGVVRADCPDGVRPTTEAERHEYLRVLLALRAVPPAPAGWVLRRSRVGPSEAPASVCKGPMTSVPPQEVSYVSLEQERLNAQRQREHNARIAALRKLPAEEQARFDELSRQGMQLSAQSGTARREKNTAEADRLLALAKQSYAQSRTLQQAHAQRIAPQIRAIEEERDTVPDPVVRVHLTAQRQPATRAGAAEQVDIPGAAAAFFDRHGALVVSLGLDAAGNDIQVRLEGDRERVLTIARLFTQSNLRTPAAK